jgi:hypothetical protein
MQLLFEQGKHGEDGLPVGVVEKGDAPQHPHHRPLVAVRLHARPPANRAPGPRRQSEIIYRL